MDTSIELRQIVPRDNATLASIIRESLTEFGADRPGTVYFDKATDNLFALFQTEQSRYFVAVASTKILGGGGIFPTSGLPEDTCELVKMYLLPEARGKGIGKLLINKCIEAAQEFGFKNMYLETLPELKKAVKVYEKSGFTYLDKPLGNSGHFGCDLWMMKKLDH